MEYLFVYGSLCPGEENAGLLTCIGGEWEAGQVHGRLVNAHWRTQGGYPFIILDKQSGPVKGFLFSSPDLAQHWDALDTFEGDEYARVLVDVTTTRGSTVQAYVYSMKV